MSTNLGDKRLGVYTYFSVGFGFNAKIGFCIKDILDWLGHVRDRHKNGIEDKLNNLILELERCEYFKLDTKTSYDKFCKATLSYEKFYPDNKFAIIYIGDLEKIIEFKNYVKDTYRISSSILLLVLSFIRLRMLKRSEYQTVKDKPEAFYHTFKNMGKTLDLTERQISNAVKLLNQLDIIYSEELPRYQDAKGQWHSNYTIFVDKYKYKNGQLVKDYDYKDELKYGKDFVKTGFNNKKFNQDINMS